MEAKLQFPFSNVNMPDGGFLTEVYHGSKSCRFQFSGLNTRVSDSHVVWKQRLQVCFQSRYIGVSPWVACKQKLRFPV